MGLVVDEILDVVEDRLEVELSGDRPGLLGTAVIGGPRHRRDRHRLLAHPGARRTGSAAATARGRSAAAQVLVVEDSDFFRNLLVPALAAEGYEVTACDSAAEALRLRDAGAMFDAVVSDIEMPEMDGLEFVRTLRAGGAWAELPVIALSGRMRDCRHARPGATPASPTTSASSTAQRCSPACASAWAKPCTRHDRTEDGP